MGLGNRTKDRAKIFKGKSKKNVGKATGNNRMKAKGTVGEIIGKLKQMSTDSFDSGTDDADSLRSRADQRKGTGGSSFNIPSHSSRHSSQIRLSPADAIAATWSRRLPQKLHCSAPAASIATWIVAMGVGAVRPGSAITACARLAQPSQMYASGPATPAISFLTCFWVFPQNEHDRRFPE
jgi:uncharacterized protein YjbJ (UPF0337 family)